MREKNATPKARHPLAVGNGGPGWDKTLFKQKENLPQHHLGLLPRASEHISNTNEQVLRVLIQMKWCSGSAGKNKREIGSK
jgi:hypothetical protein